METARMHSSENDDEERVLGELLDVFGSVFSFREIASAFTKAGHNLSLVADILYDSKGYRSNAATTNADGDLGGAQTSEMLCENIAEKPTHTERKSKTSKPKRSSASIGTVSSVLGKEYSRPTKSLNEPCKAIKPLKLSSVELPMSELWEEDTLLDSAVRTDPMHEDVEEFLYKMLGSGFQLGKDVIREVLGYCGYDAKKSMEKLIDLSASTLKKSDDIVGTSIEFSDKHPKPDSLLYKKEAQCMDTARRNGIESLSRDKRRDDLSREVLTSLFNVPERLDVPRRTRPVRVVKKARAVGKVVGVESLIDTTLELSIDIVKPQRDADDDVEEEDGYEVLRRAAKEHWDTMKEYYKSAVDAFANGDHDLANKLLEQGQFYNNKAREADEKSAQKILECRNKENQDEMILDLHDHDVKEAMRLVKLHLTSLSGITAIQHLKIIVETNAEDITKGSRKRLVLKLLERESIKWTEEEGNGGTILIQLNEIDPKKLSFAKTQNKH